MNALSTLPFAACLCMGVSVACGVYLRVEQSRRVRRRKAAYGKRVRMLPGPVGVSQNVGLRYLGLLTRRLYTGATHPLVPSVRAGKSAETRAGMWYRRRAQAAGCSKDVSTAAFCEARIRLRAIGALGGAFLGVVFSTELSVVLGVAFAFVAGSLPARWVRAACRERTVCAQQHLSEMLEVVALGLRSGLTFDRSFAMYGSHFDNVFAQSCAKAYRSWSLGLVTRDEALRELAGSYECDQLSRVVDSIVRSLRFGAALADVLEEAAAQSRASYRSALEERVAKAPVKMMLPTGTLILPAMLLLVMGPILLELASGF